MPEEDFVTQGAAAALPQSSGTGGPASTNPQAVMQLLQALKGGSGPSGSLTTSQSTVPAANMPTLHTAQAPQIAQAPAGGFASTGARKRADKQAMMNNLANLTNQGVQAHHEKQVREMESLATRASGAHEGKQQAEAMLKQDPNNAEAKNQLQRNDQILKDIFSDPKNVKKFEKAYSVKLIGDDKGRATPEYQGLMQAVKTKDKEGQANAGGAMANKFYQQFPSSQQVSPQMQAQAALIKMGVAPAAGEQLKAQTETLKEIVSYSKTLDTNASREKVAGMLVDAKTAQQKNDLIKMSMSVNGKQATAQILATAQVKRAQIMANASMEDTQWRMAGQLLINQLKSNSSNKTLSGLKSEYDTTQKELKDLSVEAKAADEKWFNSANTKTINDRIQAARQRQGAIVKRMEQLNLMKDADAGAADNTGSGTVTGTTSGGQDQESTNFDRLFEPLLNDTDPQ